MTKQPWLRRGRKLVAETGRSLSKAVNSELNEQRQRRYLQRKHEDMLDLLGHNYLGCNEAVMSLWLPYDLPLNVIRHYIRQDEAYPQLKNQVYDRSNPHSSQTNEEKRRRREQLRLDFVNRGSHEADINPNVRLQILFNLSVMGALKDADLDEVHRQSLDNIYQTTKKLVSDKLPRSGRSLILYEYPFIHPNQGWSPFAKI